MNEKIVKNVKAGCIFVWFCGFLLFLAHPFLAGNGPYIFYFIGPASVCGIACLFFSFQNNFLGKLLCHYVIPVLSALMAFAVINIMTGNSLTG